MGGERTGTRKFVFLCVAGLILTFAAGCSCPIIKKTGAGDEHSKVEETRPEPAAVHLVRAKRLLAQGDYDDTLKENQKALVLAGKNIPGDEALFNMGLVYAHYKNPKKDFNKAMEFFERMIREFPQSALIEQAKIWRGVLQVIERSKQVDREIEEMRKGLSQ